MPSARDAAMNDAELHQTAAELRLALGHLVRRVRTEDSLPPGQGTALGHLDRDGAMTASELALADRVRQQSMARTVALLVDAGYVESGPHPTDGRKQLLAITAAGRAALRTERERRIGWLAEAIRTQLTDDEQRALAESTHLLQRLSAP
jgi:DNA-binding MarR family transcriptional regulator